MRFVVADSVKLDTGKAWRLEVAHRTSDSTPHELVVPVEHLPRNTRVGDVVALARVNRCGLCGGECLDAIYVMGEIRCIRCAKMS